MLENILLKTRNTMHMGEPVTYENLTIVPILDETDVHLEYLGMKTALEKTQIAILEVSESGAVPNLKVVNHSELPVLIINGEEVVGAKQNRIVNTSLLVPAKKELQIPVSCTERGRWSYNSSKFSDSGVVLAARARGISNQRVSASLKEERGFDADQGAIWRDVADLHQRGGTTSRTEAMKDAFISKEKQIQLYQAAFPIQERQKGMIVFMNGQLVGMDYLSNYTAYHDIHNKLLKSHIIEAIAEKNASKVVCKIKDTAKVFLDRQLTAAMEERDSVGLGKDLRLEDAEITSAVLAFEGQVVHWTAYPKSMMDSNPRVIR